MPVLYRETKWIVFDFKGVPLKLSKMELLMRSILLWAPGEVDP